MIPCVLNLKDGDRYDGRQHDRSGNIATSVSIFQRGACKLGDESHSFTYDAVSSWRALRIRASRSGPGWTNCASSFSRKACSAKRSCNGSLGWLAWV
jgi:hypothetical protein